MREPIFVVGTTRSGTTLLGLMLGHHPEICFPGEFEWAMELLGPDGAPPDMDELRSRLATDRHFLGHALSLDPGMAFDAQLDHFLLQMKEGEGQTHKARLGVAMHRGYLHLLRFWPDARIIHIVRDGRDVCASWIAKGWVGNIWAGLHEWAAQERVWDRFAPEVPPQQALEVRFEDLIADAPAELRRICAFLDLEYSPDMLRYPEDTTYEAVDPGQADKWRHLLDAREIQLAEAAAGDFLVQRGYRLSEHPRIEVGALEERILGWQSRIQLVRARIRSFGAGLWLADVVSRKLGPPSWRQRVRLRMNATIDARVK
jgi:hypothetical protein